MDNNTVLKVEHLSKKFCRKLKRSMYYGAIDITRSMLGLNYDPGMLRKDEFWALDDISFELKRGESLGLVGQNGCGKTTLLRLINGIFPPDKGRITISGRIGALIAVGAGFHPHMTGRENIYLNGTILGMTRREIDSKIDSIIEFSEIGDFLEAPVSTYSSGMTVRLGFSIAVHTHPDILLVDEILAVGDASFTGKCYNKMKELQNSGVSIILVSHNAQAMLDRCSRGVLFNSGRMVAVDEISTIMSKYDELLAEKLMSRAASSDSSMGDSKDNPLRIRMFLMDINNSYRETLEVGEPFYVVVEIDSDFDLDNTFISIYMNSKDGNLIFNVRNDYYDVSPVKLKKGFNTLKVLIKNLHLMPGGYTLNIVAINRSNEKPFMNNHNIIFNINGVKKGAGLLWVDADWKI